MHRNSRVRRRHELWIERVAWNAAAAAALSLMIWVLLCSLQWLDRIAPQAPTDAVGAPLGPAASLDLRAEEPSGETPPIRRPSG